MKKSRKLVMPLSLLLAMTSISVHASEGAASQPFLAPDAVNVSETDLLDAYSLAGLMPVGMETSLTQTKPVNLTSGANVLDPGFTFYPTYTVVYATEGAEFKVSPSEDSETAGSVEQYDSFMLTGMSDQAYQEVYIDGGVFYMEKDVMTADEGVIKEMKAEDERKAEEARKKAEAERKAKEEAERKAEEERLAAEAAAQAAEAQAQAEAAQASYTAPVQSYGSSEGYTTNWDGSVLTASAGVNYGPSGKETYYNLDMSGVVNNMYNMGYGGEYWVRDDGAKMLGDYVIVAANLDVHPRGSLVETSLGTGIVADTGGFAAGNPNQVDIATAW